MLLDDFSEYVILHGVVHVLYRNTNTVFNVKTNGTIKFDSLPEDIIRVGDMVLIESKGPYNGHQGHIISINNSSTDVIFDGTHLANFEPEQLIKIK